MEGNDSVLLRSIVGSHLWGMEHAKSDTDYFEIYAADPCKILDGTADTRSTFAPGDTEDVARHEIGHVIEQLLKGNINYLLGALSPKIVHESPLVPFLRKITVDNLARNCYHSIAHMAAGNLSKYANVRVRVDPIDITWAEETINRTEEALRAPKMLRTLKFGSGVLSGKPPKFDSVGPATYEDVKDWLWGLYDAYLASPLPDRPCEAPFREWLLGVRLGMLPNGLEDW